jgi:hypothetical protein
VFNEKTGAVPPRNRGARCLQKLPEKGAFFIVFNEKMERFPRRFGALDASKSFLKRELFLWNKIKYFRYRDSIGGRLSSNTEDQGQTNQNIL